MHQFKTRSLFNFSAPKTWFSDHVKPGFSEFTDVQVTQETWLETLTWIDKQHSEKCLPHAVSLTDKPLVNWRFVVPHDQYKVDRETGSDDGKSNKTLDGVVEQWKHDKKRHDDKEGDRQQNVHLQHRVSTGTEQQ